MYKCPKCGGEILAYRSELHFVRYRIEGDEANFYSTYDDEMIEVYAEGFECTMCFARYKDAYGEQPIYKFVFVKGGILQMGGNEGDDDEKLVHIVNLTYDYLIGECGVTFNDYNVFCKETTKRTPNDNGWGQGTRPVMNVSWNDAIAYCNWVSEKEGIVNAYDSNGNLLDGNGNRTTDIKQVKGYRLPTEAEWEYAARGGHKTNGYKYSGSDDLNEVGWYDNNSDRQTHPVGEKKPNVLGIYDMSGNVWEWCNDRWEDYSSTIQTNPTGSDGSSYRVCRGGSWYGDVQRCHVAYRSSLAPMSISPDLGFRIVRTASECEK